MIGMHPKFINVLKKYVIIFGSDVAVGPTQRFAQFLMNVFISTGVCEK